jgi:membrane-associated phospholipid phosphatase
MQVLNDRALEGIVTMPSFHAAAAILLGFTYWYIKSLRWLFLTLNVIMLASAVPVGGHYLVDVVAGSVIAAASILISHRILPICSGAFHFEHSRAARCAFLCGLR